MVNGKTKTLGVIGDPVSHSLSPAMHNEAISYLQINYCYLPFLAREGDLKEAIQGVKSLNIRGINVTMPHKEEVLNYLDKVSKEAREIGAVNTVVNESNELVGYNTDGEGFVKSIAEKGYYPEGKSVAVLGVGGAAKSVIYSLAKHGVSKLKLFNRTYERAKSLASELEQNKSLSAGDIEVHTLDQKHLEGSLDNVDIIINGLPIDPIDKEGNLMVPVAKMNKTGLAVDFRYHPEESDFLLFCRQNGLVTMNGLMMLLYQGVISFQLFTGLDAPVEVMKQAILSK